MKTLLAIYLIVGASFATSVWAGEMSALILPYTAVVTGDVLEVKEVDLYTYLRLKTKDGETWVAVSKAAVKRGTKVTVKNVMVMNNFENKALKKTFPTILFDSLSNTGKDITDDHSGIAKGTDNGRINVTKVSGDNAWTVAEIVAKAAELKDKPLRVRGKVVKYNSGIMRKNWIDLRDGTGIAIDNTNDVQATTAAGPSSRMLSR